MQYFYPPVEVGCIPSQVTSTATYVGRPLPANLILTGTGSHTTTTGSSTNAVGAQDFIREGTT